MSLRDLLNALREGKEIEMGVIVNEIVEEIERLDEKILKLEKGDK